MDLPEGVREIFIDIARDLGEEPPPDLDDEARFAAYWDRLMAHAMATGRLERVSYRAHFLHVHGDDGGVHVEPGGYIYHFPDDGQPVLICCEDPDAGPLIEP